MTEEPRTRLTAEEAKARVAECRHMAKVAKFPEHRIMLEHMAETWQRIAADMEGQPKSN